MHLLKRLDFYTSSNYSGDTDGRVPVTTTRYSMNKLGSPVKTPWYPWYYQGEVRSKQSNIIKINST